MNRVYTCTDSIKEYKIITLCGDSLFKEEFIEQAKILTMQGYIVLSTNIFSENEKLSLTVPEIENLAKMNKRKIDMSDEIFVINKNGYIGQSTLVQIQYANLKGKKVIFLESSKVFYV